MQGFVLKLRFFDPFFFPPFQLIDVDGEYLTLLTADYKQKADVKLPGGALGEKIQQLVGEGKEATVTVFSAMGMEKAIAVKDEDAEEWTYIENKEL